MAEPPPPANSPRQVSSGDPLSQPTTDHVPAGAPVTLAREPRPTDRGVVRNVPGYDILREIGRGASGTVYQARHMRLGREVALKVVVDDGHRPGSGEGRFLVEARAV